MRHLIPGWLRVTAIFLVIIGLTEYFIDSGKDLAIIEYPILQMVLLVALLFLISAEVIVAAIENTMFKTLSSEAKERFMAARQARIEKYSINGWMKKVFGSKSEIEERDLELDHNYDGIKELDNKLPTWWLYSFYISIVFGVVYMFYYHVFDGVNQATEFENEMAAARIELEEYKKTAPDLVDAENVVILTEVADIEKGNAIFQMNCIACHAADGGGGIGPNLTDNHWILGGGIKEVFHTVSEGGRAGKGMIAWKSTLKPTEIQQVASYILSLKDSSPANPKEAEGEIWTGE